MYWMDAWKDKYMYTADNFSADQQEGKPKSKDKYMYTADNFSADQQEGKPKSN